MAQKLLFFLFSTSLKQPAGGASYYARRLTNCRPWYSVKIPLNSTYRLRHFSRTLNMEKCQNLVSVCKTFKKIFLQITYSTEFFDIACK